MTGCPLLILGTTRSGTSACALAMKALGLDFGNVEDVDLVSEHNPDGVMENRKLLPFAKNMLSLFQGDAIGTTVPENWKEWPETPGLVESLREFIPKYFGDARFFGWKDPRISILLPVFREVFRRLDCEPHFLLPLRHPLDVAASWERTYGVNAATSLSFWLRSILSSLKYLQGTDFHICSYSELLQDPRACLEPFVVDLPIEPRTEQQWQAVRAAIRPELSHSARPIEDLQALRPDLIYRVYMLGLDMSHDRLGAKAGKYDPQIDELWNEWSDLRELNRIDIQRLRIAARWLGADGQPATHSAQYRSDRIWCNAAIPITDAGDGRVGLQFQPTGSVVFLRNVQFVTDDGKAVPVEVFPSGLAYMDKLPGGLFRVLCHAEGPHLALRSPTPGASGQFEFDVMADYSARSLSWVAQQMGAEIIHLRERASRFR